MGLALAHPEGVFLRDQIELRAGQSLFAWFASRCGTSRHDIDHDDMWADDLLEAYPARLADEVVHARNFAVTMHGAALCYNALLAERGCTEQCSDRGGVAWEELREGLRPPQRPVHRIRCGTYSTSTMRSVGCAAEWCSEAIARTT